MQNINNIKYPPRNPDRFLFWNEQVYDGINTREVPFGNTTALKIENERLRRKIEFYYQHDVCGMKNPLPRKFPGSLPITILRSQKHNLFSNDYIHGVKLTGERYKLLCFKLYCGEDKMDRAKRLKELERIKAKADEERLKIITFAETRKKYHTKKKQRDIDFEQKAQEAVMAVIKEAENEMGAAAAEFNATPTTATDDSSLHEDVEEEALPATEIQNNQSDERIIDHMKSIVAVMDRKCDIYIIHGISVKESLFPALFDAELIRHDPSSIIHLLLFNVTMTNGKLHRDFAYEDRLRMVHGAVDRMRMKTLNTFDIPFKILAKEQYPFHRFNEVYHLSQHGSYKCDGTIAAINRCKAIEAGTDTHTVKIKHVHTMDLKLEPSTDAPEIYVKMMQGGRYNLHTDSLLNSKTLTVDIEQSVQSLFSKNMPWFIERGSESWAGKIFECEWDLTSQTYVAVLERPDKTDPNNARVIYLTKINVQEAITPTEMFRDWQLYMQDLYKTVIFKPLNTQREDALLKFDRPQHESNYFQKLMTESNWRYDELLTNSTSLLERVSSMKLSWEQQKIGGTYSILTEAMNHTAVVSSESKWLSSVGQSKGLKPVIKRAKKRKGRTPGTKNAVKKPKVQKKRKRSKIEDSEGEEDEDENDDDEDEAAEEGESELDEDDEEEEDDENDDNDADLADGGADLDELVDENENEDDDDDDDDDDQDADDEGRDDNDEDENDEDDDENDGDDNEDGEEYESDEDESDLDDEAGEETTEKSLKSSKEK